jgi:hypothetical protein
MLPVNGEKDYTLILSPDQSHHTDIQSLFQPPEVFQNEDILIHCKDDFLNQSSSSFFNKKFSSSIFALSPLKKLFHEITGASLCLGAIFFLINYFVIPPLLFSGTACVIRCS